jgi:hypothetical protein
MRDTAKAFLKFEVGDGKHIHLWMDNWHPYGALFEKYGYQVIYILKVEWMLSLLLYCLMDNGAGN